MRLTKEILVYAVSFLLLTGALSLWWRGVRPGGQEGLKATAPISGSDSPSPPGSEMPQEGSAPGDQENVPKTIYVHVAGAVKKPGVYQLGEGQRVFEAVKMAEPKEDADLDALNLALYLKDQDKIYVPKKGETEGKTGGWLGVAPDPGSSGAYGTQPGQTGGGSTGGSSVQFPININTASPQELDLLPGIGPSLAAAIVNYRAEFGLFQKPEDITKVPGIGAKTYQKFSKLITTK